MFPNGFVYGTASTAPIAFRIKEKNTNISSPFAKTTLERKRYETKNEEKNRDDNDKDFHVIFWQIVLWNIVSFVLIRIKHFIL